MKKPNKPWWEPTPNILSPEKIRELSLHEMIDPGDLDAPNPNFREGIAKDFRRNILEVFLLGLIVGAIVPVLLAFKYYAPR